MFPSNNKVDDDDDDDGGGDDDDDDDDDNDDDDLESFGFFSRRTLNSSFVSCDSETEAS